MNKHFESELKNYKTFCPKKKISINADCFYKPFQKIIKIYRCKRMSKINIISGHSIYIHVWNVSNVWTNLPLFALDVQLKVMYYCAGAAVPAQEAVQGLHGGDVGVLELPSVVVVRQALCVEGTARSLWLLVNICAEQKAWMIYWTYFC